MTAPSNSPEIELPERLRHFTDREAAIAAFDALWPGDGAWVLAFTGMSGNGKTTLIDYLIETRCKPAGIPWAIIDFEGSRGLTLRTKWDALLDTLASQWGLATHPLYTNGREAAQAEYETIRHAHQVHVEQIAEQGQIEGSPITIDASQSEALRQADQRRRHATGGALAEAAAATYANQPLVLFLDTYELLARAADKEYAGWLWAWLGAATAQLPGLRVIVGSRDELTGLARREHHQETLDVFSRDESDHLLRELGVDDPAWRTAVFERLADGHPLLTEMAADLWQEAQKSGDTIPVAAIPELAGQEKAVEWLTGRILDRLEEPIKGAVRWAALLRRFDQELLDALLSEGIGHLSDEDWDRLRRYSFVSSARVGQGWACHDLLRRVQNAYLSAKIPKAYRAFHARTAAYFASEEDEVEALYHGLMAGDESIPEVWRERTHAAYLWLDWARWSALLEVVESPELHPPPALQADARFWRGQWYRWRYEMTPALQSYAQALQLFRAVGARLGEANTLKAIGDVLQFRDERDAALDSYQQALQLFRAVGDRLGEANTLQAIGDVQQFRDDRDAALDSYQQALQLFRAVGARLGEANTLKAIGDVQQFRKEIDAALDSYQQALQLFRDVGARLGEANVLLAVAPFEEEPAKAFARAISLYEGIGDRYSMARGLYYYGLWLRDQGRAHEAQTVLNQSQDILLTLNLTNLATVAQRQIAELAFSLAQEYETKGNISRGAKKPQTPGKPSESIEHYQAAIEWFAEAKKLYAALGKAEASAFAALSIGRCLAKSGAWYRGLEVLRREVLPAFRTLDNSKGKAQTFQQIGIIHQLMGDYELAQMDYQDAIRHYKQVGDYLGIASTEVSLGQLAIQMQELDKAVTILSEALPVLRRENGAQLERAKQLLELAQKAKHQQAVLS